MRSLFIPVLALICLVYCSSATAAEVLRIGRPATEIKKEYARLYPIAEYLGKHLEHAGISSGDVIFDGQNSIAATMELMRQGKIDLVMETPYSALQFIKAGATPLLSISREGVERYHTVIFVRKDSGLRSLQDLRGRIVAFEDPGSTSAYHLPRRALEQAGLKLVALADPERANLGERTGYVFAGSELNISSWVYFGKVAAGTLSNLDWSTQDEAPQAFRKEFMILHETDAVPRMLVLARPGLDPGLAGEIVDLMVRMHESEEGRRALANYKMDRFTRIENPAAYTRKLGESLTHGEE